MKEAVRGLVARGLGVVRSDEASHDGVADGCLSDCRATALSELSHRLAAEWCLEATVWTSKGSLCGDSTLTWIVISAGGKRDGRSQRLHSSFERFQTPLPSARTTRMSNPRSMSSRTWDGRLARSIVAGE